MKKFGLDNMMWNSAKYVVLLTVLLTASVTYAQTDSISQEITQLLQSVRTVSPRATGAGQGPDEPARLSIGTDGYLRYLGAPPLGSRIFHSYTAKRKEK